MRSIIWPEHGDVKKIDILNRSDEWDLERVVVDRADKKHDKIVTKEIWLELDPTAYMFCSWGKDNMDEFENE